MTKAGKLPLRVLRLGVLVVSVALSAGCTGSSNISPAEATAATGKGVANGVKGGVLLIAGILAAPFGEDAVVNTMQTTNRAMSPYDAAVNASVNSILIIGGSKVRIVDRNRFNTLSSDTARYKRVPAKRDTTRQIERRSGRKPISDYALLDTKTNLEVYGVI